jgi:hypothetical protein
MFSAKMPPSIWTTSGSTLLKTISTRQIAGSTNCFNAFEAIGLTPGIGHSREDLTSHHVLFFPVGAYVIIYRAINQMVEIVAVTQGARDIPSFLHSRLGR